MRHVVWSTKHHEYSYQILGGVEQGHNTSLFWHCNWWTLLIQASNLPGMNPCPCTWQLFNKAHGIYILNNAPQMRSVVLARHRCNPYAPQVILNTFSACQISCRYILAPREALLPSCYTVSRQSSTLKLALNS